MDRIIKFRAWDEGNKIMHHNFQWFDSTKGGVDKEGTSWICFISDKEDADRSTDNGIIFNNPYFFQQLKKMQFTGRADKNGIDIYEGDILKTDTNMNAQVIYRDDLSSFVCRLIPDGRATLCIEAAWHVIGNIYENPEMIENYTKPNSEAIVKNVLDDNPDIIRNFEKLVDNHIVDMLVKGEIPLDKIPDSKEKECIGLKVNWIKPKD